MFHLTAEGQSGAAVAERLFISPRTVESHRANLMRKLGLRNHKELIRYAAQTGGRVGGTKSVNPVVLRMDALAMYGA